MATILLVEDDDDIAELLAFRLSLKGHAVERAADGRDGVEKALGLRPDLVLLDMNMPAMGGREAVRALRAEGYRGRVVSLSAAANESDLQAALKAGCDGGITKPVGADFEALVAAYLKAG